MKLPLFLLLTASILTASAQSDSTFNSMLERAGMTFSVPAQLPEGLPHENRQMGYQKVYKNKKKKFEVRYAVFPLDSMLADYEASKNDPNVTMVDPNKLCKSFMLATSLNISGATAPQYTEFDKDAVKTEFNADWGATVFVTCGKEFANGYKYCLMVLVHRDNLGDAFIFFMGNNSKTIVAEMEPLFHALKFR